MEKMANLISFKIARQGWISWRTSKAEIISLLGILSVAAFLRLNKISEYMTFLGDEGRDAIVARNIIQGDFTFLGPRASTGDFFLGPIYYYMMAPFLWAWNFDPVGPAIMVALIGIATVFLVYLAGKKFFGVRAGIFASALYAVSPIVVAFSRSSWNPNPMPFFSLLSIFILYYAVKKNSRKLFITVGILLGISLQLHYLATFLGVIIFTFMFFGIGLNSRTNVIKRYISSYFELVVGFIIGFSPFLAFEIRHNFPNIRTILRFVFGENLNAAYESGRSFSVIVQDVFFRVYARLITKFPPPEQVSVSDNLDLQVLQIATIAIMVLSVFALIFVKNKLVVLLMIIWLFVGVLLFGFYKRPVFDYYFGFLFTAPFLLVGNLLQKITYIPRIRPLGLIVGISIFVILLLQNISGHPFQYTPNNQRDQAEMIANFVLDQTNGKPYNFALVTNGNSDHVFRYFFEINNRPPVVIENTVTDAKRKTVTDQLLVVCDTQCEVIGHPLWEVAGFGPAEIENTWAVSVVTIYKLKHADKEDTEDSI